MTIDEAVRKILGDEYAQQLINEMDIDWAVVVATAIAQKSDCPKAIETIRNYNEEQK